MTDIASWLEARIMEYVFDGTEPPTPPSELYVGLHTGDPGEDGSSNEVSASDYSRKQTSLSIWTVSGSGPTEAENSNAISFPRAENNWGAVSHGSLWDDTAGSNGNCLWKGDLNSTQTIETDDRMVIGSNEFTATIN